jgi:hypothetical protein
MQQDILAIFLAVTRMKVELSYHGHSSVIKHLETIKNAIVSNFVTGANRTVIGVKRTIRIL